ncbi:transposase [Streptomyces anulatus]|uniref:transposase n=1 Tax=Streptomyces anulatus TaxID=1892 RepID=UPI0036872599
MDASVGEVQQLACVYNRLRMWAIDGTWERFYTALMAQSYADEDRNWDLVDFTIVRVHQHADGARKGAPSGEPADRAIGRSRGGLTTKIHLAAVGRCRPLAFHLTAGQDGDAPAFTAVMVRLRVSHRCGRPRTRPDMVLTDKAYCSRVIVVCPRALCLISNLARSQAPVSRRQGEATLCRA